MRCYENWRHAMQALRTERSLPSRRCACGRADKVPVPIPLGEDCRVNSRSAWSSHMELREKGIERRDAAVSPEARHRGRAIASARNSDNDRPRKAPGDAMRASSFPSSAHACAYCGSSATASFSLSRASAYVLVLAAYAVLASLYRRYASSDVVSTRHKRISGNQSTRRVV